MIAVERDRNVTIGAFYISFSSLVLFVEQFPDYVDETTEKN